MKCWLVATGLLLVGDLAAQKPDTVFASLDSAEAAVLLRYAGTHFSHWFIQERAFRTDQRKALPRDIDRIAELTGARVKSTVPACDPKCSPEITRDLEQGHVLVLVRPRVMIDDSTVGVTYEMFGRTSRGPGLWGTESARYLKRGDHWVLVGTLRRLY